MRIFRAITADMKYLRLRFRRILILFTTLTLLIYAINGLIPSDAEGRPGGGSRFRSGRSSGSRGGSSGGGGYYGGSGGSRIYVVPGGGGNMGVIIAILIIVVIALYIYSRYGANNQEERISSAPLGDDLILKKQRVRSRMNHLLKSKDPNFSSELLSDFIQLLYTQLQQRRSKPEFMQLRPYVDEQLLNQWSHAEKMPVEVSEVVIGSIDITDFFQNNVQNIIVLEIDANYTEKRDNKNIRVQSVERWVLRRQAGVISPEPDKMRSLSCPNCGSSLEVDLKGACRHCGSVVQPGTQQWQISERVELERHVSKGEHIGNYAEEVGTNFPTVFDPHLDAEVHEFIRRHKLNDMYSYWHTFSNSIVQPVYMTLLEAWTSLDWEKARPLITDNLFQSYYYWIDFYKRSGVKPVMKAPHLQNAELVKIETDRFYESITVRIFATGYDYIEDKNGKVIAGKSQTKRDYSEYWTFIRKIGVEKPESEFNAKRCPSCGAPVKMGQSGVCDYCGSKVTQGDFGWVLSRITQDEVYFG